MKTNRLAITSLLASLLLVAGGFTALNSQAQSTDTWVGGTGNNFSTLANWTYSAGSGPMATGDSLVFDTTGSTSITSTNIIVDPTKPTVFYRLKL